MKFSKKSFLCSVLPFTIFPFSAFALEEFTCKLWDETDPHMFYKVSVSEDFSHALVTFIKGTPPQDTKNPFDFSGQMHLTCETKPNNDLECKLKAKSLNGKVYDRVYFFWVRDKSGGYPLSSYLEFLGEPLKDWKEPDKDLPFFYSGLAWIQCNHKDTLQS